MPHTQCVGWTHGMGAVGSHVVRSLESGGGADRLNEILGSDRFRRIVNTSYAPMTEMLTPERRKQLGASATASACATLLLSPLSVLKTRVQSGEGRAQVVFNNILRRETPLSFWRGAPVSLAMTMPSMMLYIGCYEGGREALAAQGWGAASTPVAAFASRCVTGAVMAPAEMVRTVQASGGAGGRGVVALVSDLVRHGGVGRLYKGLGATVARDAPYSALYWSTFEALRPTISASLGAGEGSSTATFASGACAGSLAVVATHPWDVLKTRVQVAAAHATRGAVGGHPVARAALPVGLASIARAEGLKGLYTGLGMRLATSVPGSGITITIYDFLKKL